MWFFKGILKGLLLDSLVFVVTLYPGWGCTFLVIFFWPVHGKCSDWGWAELLYSYKILTQQSSPNTNPDISAFFLPTGARRCQTGFAVCLTASLFSLHINTVHYNMIYIYIYVCTYIYIYVQISG